MSGPDVPRVDVIADAGAVRLVTPELVAGLRQILGAKRVAYLGSVKETRAVRQWADGERGPSLVTVGRLGNAYHVAALLWAEEATGKGCSAKATRNLLEPSSTLHAPSRQLVEPTDRAAVPIAFGHWRRCRRWLWVPRPSLH